MKTHILVALFLSLIITPSYAAEAPDGLFPEKEKKPWEIHPEEWEISHTPFGPVWFEIAKQNVFIPPDSDTKINLPVGEYTLKPGQRMVFLFYAPGEELPETGPMPWETHPEEWEICHTPFGSIWYKKEPPVEPEPEPEPPVEPEPEPEPEPVEPEPEPPIVDPTPPGELPTGHCFIDAVTIFN